MHLSVDDYVIVEGRNNKPQLAKILALKGGQVRVRLEKNAHLPTLRQIIDVEQRGVILNLGKSPYKGHVLGNSTHDLYQRTVEHPIAGPIHFFYRPEKEVGKAIGKAFVVAHNQLRKFGLEQLLEDAIVWEVYTGDGPGKYAGMYYPRQPDIETPVIRIRPEKMSPSFFPYVLNHELGHHMHFQYCMDHTNLNGAWVKLYKSTIQVTPVSSQHCKSICKAFESSGQSVNGFKRSLEEDDRKAFGKILSYIRSNHQLSPSDINILIASNNWEEVESCWPTQITEKDLKPLVSEYALKNPRELFAEAFAFYVTGTKLPRPAQALIEKTISYARTQFGR